MSNLVTPTLFVAMSHTLTQSQIEGFTAQYGTGTIVTLKEVAPELQAQMSQIPATAALSDIQQLAKAIVTEAVKVGATHFYCVGEPTLTIWANIYADKFVEKEVSHFFTTNVKGEMTCIQSTTERKSVETHNPDGTVSKSAVFEHVQWREMF